MISIIESNITLDEKDNFVDFQSRVIEHKSWNDYVEEIKLEECKFHAGTMHGCTLPKLAKVENLKHDDFHLSCDVHNGVVKFKKFAYLIADDILANIGR